MGLHLVLKIVWSQNFMQVVLFTEKPSKHSYSYGLVLFGQIKFRFNDTIDDLEEN